MSNTNSTLINVEIIPHNQQRYPTVGDWQWDMSGSLKVKISKMPDKRHMLLIAIHEIVEAILCKIDNVTDNQVTNWDMDHLNDVDPGGIIGSPYYAQHHTATLIEGIMAQEMNVNWNDYEKGIQNL